MLAGAGATAGFVLEDLEPLTLKAPDRVFINLGQCDLLMPVDDPMNFFRNEYKKLIETIKDKLPDCEIYLPESSQQRRFPQLS